MSFFFLILIAQVFEWENFETRFFENDDNWLGSKVRTNVSRLAVHSPHCHAFVSGTSASTLTISHNFVITTVTSWFTFIHLENISKPQIHHEIGRLLKFQ
jgi:hypothetical protein